MAPDEDRDLEMDDDDLDAGFREDRFAPAAQGRAARVFLGPSLTAAARWFGIAILAVLVLSLLWNNWPPIRVHLVFFSVDVPAVIVYVFFAALGAVLHWLWRRRTPAGEEPEAAAPEEVAETE